MKTTAVATDSQRRFLFLTAMALLIGAFSVVGCTTMPIAPSAIDSAANIEVPKYKVIFANNMSGKPTVYTGNISESITVQDALEESGALKKYKGMKVDLARSVPEKGQVLKLPVLFDSKSRHVLEEQNYAIHPGDEILVRKDNAGALDFIVKGLGSDSTP